MNKIKTRSSRECAIEKLMCSFSAKNYSTLTMADLLKLIEIRFIHPLTAIRLAALITEHGRA